MNIIALAILITSGQEVTQYTKQERDSIGLAREVSNRVSLDRPLLIQVEFSRLLVPTYRVTPMEAPAGSDEVWQLSHTPGDPGKRVASRTWFSIGKAPIIPTTISRRMKGQAFIVAIKALDEAGRLRLPVVVKPRETDKEWRFLFDRVPLVTGGYAIVTVSKTNNKVEILPGH